MEKAIIRTLIYADIFDYPLKAWEIHKWLITQKSCSLPDVEQGLKRLLKRGEVWEKEGYFCLRGRKILIKKRIGKITSSKQYLQEARLICRIFKIVPWVKLVGVSGNLAMENAGEGDDIDLFIVTAKNRLWLSRIFMLLILSLLEKRRRKSDRGWAAAGKFCLNLLVEEDQLLQERQDLYTAHEVLQMIPLWERSNMYGRFLLKNGWVFKHLPNWVSGTNQDQLTEEIQYEESVGFRMFNSIEGIFRFLQLRYMGVERKKERVSYFAVYFHPEDNQPRVLKEYAKRIKKYIK